jgi:hypothetical protein
MEEINPRCDCRIDLVLGETITSTCGTTTYEMTLTITEYEGKEYFAIVGFENGGAGVNFGPKAEISAPSETYLDQEILFDGSQSSDPNDDPLYFYWDFGDGVTSTSAKTSHIYQNPGEYLVTLTVDDGMASSTATTTIKILSPPVSSTGREFVYSGIPSGGEEKISEKEKVKEKKIEEISQKEITKESEKPEKITKILKIEKPKEKEAQREIPEGNKEIKREIQALPQNFLPFLLASLKETITTPSIIIPAILSFSALLSILIKEIKMLKRK